MLLKHSSACSENYAKDNYDAGTIGYITGVYQGRGILQYNFYTFSIDNKFDTFDPIVYDENLQAVKWES